MPDAVDARPALARLLSATNTHDFDNVVDLLTEDVVYYFGDATLVGLQAVREYFERTWGVIREEQYWAEDIHWPIHGEEAAVAIYRFRWRGMVDGQPAEGAGRGTNVFVRCADGHWRLAHEHLSNDVSAG